ncbi:sulfate transport system ATP-binding protein [Methylopila capsulata]|uniref:Sulfate transport system ATP-binding protein n=1 Tax=Methylopila capsulata TaxID=61654 RepID=A0A9W6IW28_9HYPH|nr:sulfate ABC transporter ATP-binding protein [Methylopila capsulata]MBM7853111.1 sulfate transport system ATP-binding protein [Methylopila capsulata]GLK57676.1 sulfate/thiosulfate import ATP-binding protein CysA [Methylopila capsulata]
MDLKIRDVRKEYGSFPALNGVSLDIRSGELVALLGPSGSGKTTLLRAIAGLEIPDSGQILFGDEDALAKPVQERNVGFVFQHYALFRHMKVFDNIAFGLRVRGRARRPAEADIRRKVLELLDLVQLKGLENRYPAQLSGGQRQRVALARALAIEPQVLLLDEPFGALDAQVRKELRRWLREIHNETGHTTVFVTHDQEEALELADRVAILHKGDLQQVGTPDAIYDEPATPFVYAFIGDSSSLPIDVRSGEATLDGRALPLGRVDAPDGPARLHVRPQDVTFVAPGEGVALGRIAALRRLGAFRRADVEVGARRSRIEVRLPPEASFSEGEEVGLAFERFAVFPAEGAPSVACAA